MSRLPPFDQWFCDVKSRTIFNQAGLSSFLADGFSPAGAGDGIP